MFEPQLKLYVALWKDRNIVPMISTGYGITPHNCAEGWWWKKRKPRPCAQQMCHLGGTIILPQRCRFHTTNLCIHKVQPLIDALTVNFPMKWIIGKFNCVDDGKIPYKGSQRPVQSYDPAKPHKYGPKLHLANDVSWLLMGHILLQRQWAHISPRE